MEEIVACFPPYLFFVWKCRCRFKGIDSEEGIGIWIGIGSEGIRAQGSLRSMREGRKDTTRVGVYAAISVSLICLCSHHKRSPMVVSRHLPWCRNSGNSERGRGVRRVICHGAEIQETVSVVVVYGDSFPGNKVGLWVHEMVRPLNLRSKVWEGAWVSPSPSPGRFLPRLFWAHQTAPCVCQPPNLGDSECGELISP
ncbi:hypothetical protein RHGRI_002574 [Rhododendron griersonianum]|uniref:Uncharacterized protein n=1 Tax=Rhododendron griersonianum TaxID=479676 RepID=A0AAV6LS22_9ERIC|nr:hypothetical protein RHGRI_002574 [Rhododendron griersonianum]